MSRQKARSVFDKILAKAIFKPVGVQVQTAIRHEEVCPEYCRPGYLVESLSLEERDSLASLTSDMIYDWLALKG